MLPENIKEIQELQEKLEIQKNLILNKSLTSNDPEKIVEAAKYFKDIEERKTETKSYFIDPWDFSSQFGYRGKQTSLSYDTLRRMGRTPIINAIITTRVEQISAFSEPEFEQKSPGFIIRRKLSYFNKDKKETKQDNLKCEYISNFITNCGTNSNSWHGDNFNSFLRKIIRDSLELDQMTFEVVRNRKGIPQEFIATDAATFRISDNLDKDANGNSKKIISGYYPSYIQVHQNIPVAEFYPWELCFGIRNHYTDIGLNGYGVSELENIINIITWMLYSDTYNGKFFSQGSAPKGIIKVNGSISESKLQEFRQQWNAMIGGVQNAWKTPVMEAEKMEWIDLQRNNRDMEFTKWQEYLIKLSCASYKIDPAEIGFPMSGSSESKPMFEGNNEARLKYSKDKGLMPLLNIIESKINKYIVNPIDSNYEFKFVGLNIESENEKVELDIKKGNNFMSLMEIRRKYGLPDLPENKDDIILNPYYFQMWAQKQQQQQNGNSESNDFMNEENPDSGFENEDEDDESPFTKAFNEYVKNI